MAQPQGIRLPMHETGIWSLGREDPLEKKIATHSSILLARRIPWTVAHQGHKESDMTERLSTLNKD